MLLLGLPGCGISNEFKFGLRLHCVGMLRISVLSLVLLAAGCRSSDVLDPFDDNVRYSIHWGPVKSKSLLDKLDPSPLFMRSKGNERYACHLPSGKSLDESERVDETESPVTPEVVLAPLIESQRCLEDTQPYWTYEYCFGSKLRQFHVAAKDGRKAFTAEYILGQDVPVFSETARAEAGAKKIIPKKRIGDQDFPYHSVSLSKGTPCDLSGVERQAEIVFICVPQLSQPRLMRVKETQTCEYEAIVAVPQLCNNPAYQLPKPEIHSIYCSPVDGAPVKPSGLIEGKESTAPVEFVHMEMSGKEKLIYLKRGTQPQHPQGQPVQDEPAETITYLGKGPADAEETMTDTDAAAGGKPGTPAHPRSPPPDTGMIKQFLSGSFCLDGGAGWWLYRFCYGKHVQQYHQEPNSRKRVEIILGKWDENVHKQWLAKSPGRKTKGSYYYSNGDVCDVTQKPRSVTVKVRCTKGNFHPSQVAMALQEPSTCNYILTVESPIFCQLLESVDEDGMLKVPEV